MGNESTERVVVAVDDEEGDLAVIDAILADDYHVVCCLSGEEALHTLEKYPQAIVLCDQRMPKLTGDEVLTRLRILYPDSVRILVTGYSDTEAIVRALNEGQIFGYLQKPFDSRSLRALVERAANHQSVMLQNRRLAEENHRIRAMMDRMVRERTSALEAENLELKNLAVTDDLTGLANPRYLRTRIQEEYERYLRTGQPMALILADIDNFKAVNDTWGHAAGDQVLKAVAGAIKGAVRGADLPARAGGEEFVVVAAGTHEAGAAILAERIRVAVEALSIAIPAGTTDAPGGATLKVTVSVGLAACEPPDGPSADEALRRTDESMYQAKKAGKNRCRSWSDVRRSLATKPQSVFVSRTRLD
jgi:diguanylate cyclase (GGDEF)-like protein